MTELLNSHATLDTDTPWPDGALPMVPGPTPVAAEILAALAAPTTSHHDPRFEDDFRATLAAFARLTGATGLPFVLAGTGTLAMEIAIANLVGRGSRTLVISHGFFGDRFPVIAERYGSTVDVLRSELGEAVPLAAVADRLAAARYDTVTLTHVDTSSGVAADVAGVAALLGQYPDTRFIVDGVCATGGIEERFDEWRIDVLLTASQKALGVPPGLALLVASEAALARRRQLGSIPGYYVDLEMWAPVMRDPSNYFGTPPINLIRAMKVALEMALAEGLPARYQRHARGARALRAAAAALGLETFGSPDTRADTLSLLVYPEGVEDAAFRRSAARYGAFVASAKGRLEGKVFRVGHMGNIGQRELAVLVRAMGQALADQRCPVDIEASLTTLTRELSMTANEGAM